jgi:UDP-3-O-[3-hydroxymyristoyl] glucosamine N-acyltransferase
MPDPRFFRDRGPVALRTLVELTGARLADAAAGEVMVAGVAPLNRAGPDELSFFSDGKYADDLAGSRARACFLPEKLADRAPAGCILVLTAEPQVAYAKTADWLYPPHTMVADDPLVHPSALLEEGVQLAPSVVIGANARIGGGTSIGPNTVIGPGVEVGRDCRIGSNVSVSFALVGDRVRLLSGAVIGEAGFGMAGGVSGIFDIPQLGRVILQDNVTVGANSCIDRGSFEDTVIGDSTKIDNLVQIGHSVRLGRGCLVAAQVGISGSVTAGDGVRFGGQVGIADHLNIGDGAALLARAGLMHDVPAREAWGGYPAVPRRDWLRQTVWLARATGKIKRGEGDTKE